MTSGRLEDRIVAVTGAARGIGAAIVESLLYEGAIVVAADIDDVPLQQNERLLVTHVDITDDRSVQDMVDNALGRFGGLHGLVNNAGVRASGPEGSTPAALSRMLEVNTVGSYRMSLAARPALADGGGTIVNLSSSCGRAAVTGSLGYCVSKAAVDHLTRLMALEWAADGIRVNAVAPAIIATEMNKSDREDPEYVAAKVAAIPMGRMGTPGDVAAIVVDLIAPSAAFVTGQSLAVDGGATLR